MAKNSPEVTRLLNEFHAQDHGVELVVLQGFKRISAAKYSEGNECWEPTQAGKDLLDPPTEVPVPAPEVAKGFPPKNINVKQTLPK